MKNCCATGAAAMGLAIMLGSTDGANGLRHLQEKNYETVYFNEMMVDGDPSVVVLEVGPFKFEASCKTITYDNNYYYSSSYMGSSHMSSTSSSHISSTGSSHMSSTSSGSSSPSMRHVSTSMPVSTSHSSSFTHSYPYTTSSGCPNPCGTSSSYHDDSYSYGHSYDDDYMHSYDDDYMYSYDYDYSYDYSYTESFAALELTYTATDSDFLYGSPAYSYYPDEMVISGFYDAGESRTQTVFAGRDGGYGDDSTLQSNSGYYVTINGDMTIGIHKANSDYLPGGMDGFPEGYDCMIAGFITYIV